MTETVMPRREQVMQRWNNRSAFTLVEVLVVVGIVALLMGVMLPAINRVRETSRRTTCMGNLRAIGQGLLTYARDNKDEFPRVIAVPTANNDYLETHEPDATVTSPFANATDGKNASYAALFLLVRYDLLKPDAFVCPSTDDVVDTFDGQDYHARSNFTVIRATDGGHVVPTNCSYTYACMYPNQIATVRRMKLSTLPGGFPLAADKSLRRCSIFPDDGQTKGNSRNHKRAGQNVAYADGSVAWHTKPTAGFNGDNIYARGQGSCNMVPVLDANDAVIQEP
jgi:prepilin-type N-terminal cleavage/methylation domain-containing protein/prepilin-type processing-associated H-X9-DG protein